MADKRQKSETDRILCRCESVSQCHKLKSLVQKNLISRKNAQTTARKVCTSLYTCLGVAQPTVSAMPTRLTPALSTALYNARRSTRSDLKESSLETRFLNSVTHVKNWINSHRTSRPFDLTNSITSRAVLVMYAMSLPCECSRRKLDVPITISLNLVKHVEQICQCITHKPSTPVSTAILASSILHLTSK